ncbi:unnamed protein product [Meloidogyne enterolobii]|uniref:Uncharacterized protein n=1 Tax=Meloidogyne enterolobii TaxID=390850 RepID=A0ACB1AY42_MELEN
MGSLYRSEEMRFCQMIVERDAAFACVAELGKKPYVQFKDLNAEVNSFQRMFAKDIRRFDEMERKLSEILNNFKLIKAQIIVIGFLEAQIRKDNNTILGSVESRDPIEVMPHHEINQLEQTLVDLERDVIHMNNSDQQLKRNYLELKEWQHVLEKADQFFEGGISDAAVHEIEQQSAAAESEAGIALHSAEKEPTGRRTAFVRHIEIEEHLEHPETVCEGFKARQYNQCPRTSPDRKTALQQVQASLNDMQMVMSQTREHRMKVLNAVAANHRNWLKQVRVHKSIYSTLNNFTFDGIGKFFVAECWVPLDDVQAVREALETGVSKHGSTVKPVLNVVHTSEMPPTYNRTNKFTAVFQGIVDSYGVASYLELNPAPYTIITFPFIFSCMFGDLGHGILMFLCGLYLVVRERNLEARQIKDEIFNMFFGGRYIILLMGLFSMHAGLVYNDAFAKSFSIFGSAWKNPYPVILGIAQMTFGVCLSYQNYKYFNSSIEIFTVFIPQMIFMGSIFIYLCLQIVLKWLLFWVKPETIFGRQYPGSHCAPSLLSFLEAILVIIAVLCIPIMLFGKPIHILMHQRRAKRAVSDNMYVLGCVSHTASYLRLWALSLAHAQLSEVLWDMVLENAFAFNDIKGYIALYAIFFAFGVLTFSILVLMEGLSAFLHALRLHWVEFQSKFYLGQGYIFAPFFFKDILQRASVAEMA